MSIDFQDRMETGKAIAAARRARGLHTGKAAAGWVQKPDNRPPETWREVVDVYLEFALAEMVNDLNYTGGSFEGCSDIPF
jgi:hypothetical protein